MGKQHWMVVIAGPNGAGKSTFYREILKQDPLFKSAEYVNLDDIAKTMTQSDGEDPNKYSIAAGRIVLDQLDNLVKKKKTFIYETTSSGTKHLEIMDNAKKKGFKIATIFIGLSSVKLSHARVKQRVETEQGHDVPKDAIERRYPKIIKNFPEMLKRSDVSAVFDNSSDPFRLIFLMDESKLFMFHAYPKWVKGAFEKRKTSKDMIHITNNSFRKLKPEKISNMMNCIFQQFSHER